MSSETRKGFSCINNKCIQIALILSVYVIWAGCDSPKQEPIQTVESGYCWRSLPLLGKSKAEIEAKYGKPDKMPPVTHKPVSIPVSKVPQDADELWIYLDSSNLMVTLVYYNGERVVAAFEEWSDY